MRLWPLLVFATLLGAGLPLVGAILVALWPSTQDD